MYISNIHFSNWQEVLDEVGFENFLMQLLDQYESLGPLPGFLLTFIEALVPVLPLIVFVMVNAAAYGLIKGFILSWLGAVAGAIVVFFVIRRLGHMKWVERITKQKHIQQVLNWVRRRGFGPLFLLLCFPFSPSSVINIVAGLSKVSAKQFILAVLLGKSVMIFSVAYVGDSLTEFTENPMRTIVVIVGIALFWIVGKQIENRMNKKIDKEEPSKKDND